MKIFQSAKLKLSNKFNYAKAEKLVSLKFHNTILSLMISALSFRPGAKRGDNKT